MHCIRCRLACHSLTVLCGSRDTSSLVRRLSSGSLTHTFSTTARDHIRLTIARRRDEAFAQPRRQCRCHRWQQAIAPRDGQGGAAAVGRRQRRRAQRRGWRGGGAPARRRLSLRERRAGRRLLRCGAGCVGAPGALPAPPCVAPRCNLSPRARLFPPLPQRRCTWRARGARLATLRGWRASSSSSWPRASQRCA